jgi:hypothetical protein
MRNDHDELLRLERICLEQAELCRDGTSRAAYLSMAENYRAAADCQTPSGTAPFASLRTAPTLGFMMSVEGWLRR